MNIECDREESGLPQFDCACATVRRVARMLTQLYNEELPARLEAPQFALMSALDRRPGCTQSALARAAAFDKTTISRNIALMRRNGWIETAQGDDRRERGLRLTTAGREVLRAARPGWRRAQQRLRSAMTGEEWEQMWGVLNNLTAAAHRASQGKGDSQ
ncbi:MAG: winged helix-turn-helix transcriptional regulator [Acidobacteria bacterium]|nr:winged helix-turn-helix transcriptional regulator [Acidobacteriota bacterium]